MLNEVIEERLKIKLETGSEYIVLESEKKLGQFNTERNSLNGSSVLEDSSVKPRFKRKRTLLGSAEKLSNDELHSTSLTRELANVSAMEPEGTDTIEKFDSLLIR